MQLLLILFTFCFGAIIGSFLNVVILRLPRGETLTGRSHCPKCGHTLGALDLVPIFSFIFLKGRCRYCKSKISSRYVILETVTGLLFAAAFYYLNPVNPASAVLLIKFWLVLASLVAIFTIDLEHFLILDEVVFPAAAAILVLNIILDLAFHIKILSLHSHFISGLLAATLLWLLFFSVWWLSSGRWLGFGDVKLAILLGLILGWPLILVGFMIAVMLGGAISLFLLLFGSKTLKSEIPFGTFLALGTVFALFYGDKLLNWYLALLGF
jgi:leader peptidase (prepilin peptidase) / N-methyltransferase